MIEAQRRMRDILSLDLAGLWQRSNEVRGSFVLTHLYPLAAAALTWATFSPTAPRPRASGTASTPPLSLSIRRGK